MSTVNTFAAPGNVYVATPETTNFLTVGYSRNEGKFPVNKMLQIAPVKTTAFTYTYIDTSAGARVLSAQGEEYNWEEMQPANYDPQMAARFSFPSDRTIRKRFPYYIGQREADSNQVDLKLVNRLMTAQKAMTVRTLQARQVLEGASWGSNTADVNGTIVSSGQGWDNGTSTNPNFLNSLNYAFNQILLATYGVVTPQDLMLVLSAADAPKVAASPEIRDYMKGSVWTKDVIRGDNSQLNMLGSGEVGYGLPPMYNNIPIVVENSVVVTGNPNTNGTVTASFIYPTGKSYLISRIGGLDGYAGGPTYSTLIMFYYQDELTNEEKYNSDDRVWEGRMITDYKIVNPTTLSAFRFTRILSTS